MARSPNTAPTASCSVWEARIRPFIICRQSATAEEMKTGWKYFFVGVDRKSTRLNSSHLGISYAVFCLKKKMQLGGLGVVLIVGRLLPIIGAVSMDMLTSD